MCNLLESAQGTWINNFMYTVDLNNRKYGIQIDHQVLVNIIKEVLINLGTHKRVRTNFC